MYSPISDGFFYCGRQDCSNGHSWGPGVRNIYVLHYIIKGAGYLETGNKKYKISEGESFLIRPYEKVHYYPDKEDPWEYIWIDFDFPKYNSIIGDMHFAKGNCVTEKIPGKDILPFFEQLVNLNDWGKNRLTCYGLAQTILGIYADLFSKNDNSVYNERFNIALSIIKENYYKSDFGTAELYKKMNISRASLYRLFKENTDMSPCSFICDYRINKACEAMRSNLSVKNIAHSCGFSDVFYFSKIFKKNKGVAPSEYKKTV